LQAPSFFLDPIDVFVIAATGGAGNLASGASRGVLRALGNEIGSIGGRALTAVEQKAIRKIFNIKAFNLDVATLQAAQRELAGEVVAYKASGKAFQHIPKVREAQRGLRKHIAVLKKALTDTGLSAGGRQDIGAALRGGEELLKFSLQFVP